MADKKISALPAASTPLAGTEVLPIVQSGVTDQVSVANLTAGRDVTVKKLTPTDNVVMASGKGITTGGATALGFGINNSTTDMTLDASGNLLVGNTTQILYVNKELNVNAASGSSGFVLATGNAANLYMTAGSTNGNITTKGAIPLLLGTNETERLRLDGSTGNVGIGGAPAATAILDVQSTTKGVRFPNMTTTQKNAITPSAGTVVFDTTLSKLCVYSGAAWQTITSV